MAWVFVTICYTNNCFRGPDTMRCLYRSRPILWQPARLETTMMVSRAACEVERIKTASTLCLWQMIGLNKMCHDGTTGNNSREKMKMCYQGTL